MAKLDPTVRREALYVAGFVGVFSMLLQAVYLVIGRWNYTVLCGNLLSGAAACGNFLLLGLTVQKAVTRDEKGARDLLRASQAGRMFLLFAAACIGVLLPCFDLFAVLIPLFFPRIAIAMRPLFDKKNNNPPPPQDQA